MKRNLFSIFKNALLVFAAVSVFSACDNFLEGSSLKENVDTAILVAASVKVDDYSPRYTSNGVNCDSKISVKFTAEMDSASFKDFTFIKIEKNLKGTELYNDVSGLFSSVSLGEDKRIVEIRPDSDNIQKLLNDDETSALIRVTVKKGAKAVSGKTLLEDFNFTFLVNNGRETNAPMFMDFKIYKRKPHVNMEDWSFKESYKNSDKFAEVPAKETENNEERHLNKLWIYVKGYDSDSGVKSLKVLSEDGSEKIAEITGFNDLGGGFSEGWFEWDFETKLSEILPDGTYSFMFALSDGLNDKIYEVTDNNNAVYTFYKDSVCNVTGTYKIDAKPFFAEDKSILDAEADRFEYLVKIDGKDGKIEDSWNKGIEKHTAAVGSGGVISFLKYADKDGQVQIIYPEIVSDKSINFSLLNFDQLKNLDFEICFIDTAGNISVDKRTVYAQPVINTAYLRKNSYQNEIDWNDEGSEIMCVFRPQINILKNVTDSSIVVCYENKNGSIVKANYTNNLTDNGFHVINLRLINKDAVTEAKKTKLSFYVSYENGSDTFETTYTPVIEVPLFTSADLTGEIENPEIIEALSSLESCGTGTGKYKVTLMAAPGKYDSMFVRYDGADYYFETEDQYHLLASSFEVPTKDFYNKAELIFTVFGVKGYLTGSTEIPVDGFIAEDNISPVIYAGAARPYYKMEDNLYMGIPSPSDTGDGFALDGEGYATCTLFYTPATARYQVEGWKPAQNINLTNFNFSNVKEKLNIGQGEEAINYLFDNFEQAEGYFKPGDQNVYFPVGQLMNNTQYLLVMYCVDAAGNENWAPVYYIMTNPVTESNIQSANTKLYVKEQNSSTGLKLLYPEISQYTVKNDTGYTLNVNASILDKKEGTWDKCLSNADLGAKYETGYYGALTTVPNVEAYPPEYAGTGQSVEKAKKHWNTYMKYEFYNDNASVFAAPKRYGPYYSYTGEDSRKIQCDVCDYSLTGKGMTVISDYPVFVHTVVSKTNWGNSPIFWECHMYEDQELNPKVVECSKESMVGYYSVPKTQVEIGNWYTTILHFANGEVLMTEPVLAGF